MSLLRAQIFSSASIWSTMYQIFSKYIWIQRYIMYKWKLIWLWMLSSGDCAMKMKLNHYSNIMYTWWNNIWTNRSSRISHWEKMIVASFLGFMWRNGTISVCSYSWWISCSIMSTNFIFVILLEHLNQWQWLHYKSLKGKYTTSSWMF